MAVDNQFQVAYEALKAVDERPDESLYIIDEGDEITEQESGYKMKLKNLIKAIYEELELDYE